MIKKLIPILLLSVILTGCMSRLTPAEPMEGYETKNNNEKDQPDNEPTLEGEDPDDYDWSNPYELPEKVMFSVSIADSEMPRLMVFDIEIRKDTTVQDLLDYGFSIKDASEWENHETGDAASYYADFEYNNEHVCLHINKKEGLKFEEQTVDFADTYLTEKGITIGGIKQGDLYATILKELGPPTALTHEIRGSRHYWTMAYEEKITENGASGSTAYFDLEQNMTDPLSGAPKITGMMMIFS